MPLLRTSAAVVLPRTWRAICAILITCAALALVRAAPAAPAAVPLEVYGRLPHFENVVLSPDGSRVAFVKTEGNIRTIAVMALASGEILASVRAGDQKLRSIGWADDGHLTIATSVTTTPNGLLGNVGEWWQLQIYDVKSNRIFMVPEPNAAGDVRLMNVVVGPLMIRRLKDHTVLFVSAVQLRGAQGLGGFDLLPVLARVDLESRGSQLVHAPRANDMVWGWVVDRNGEVAAEETYDLHAARWSIAARRGGDLHEVASGEAKIDIPRMLGWGPSGESVLLQRIEDGNAVWRLLSISDGSIGPPMAERESLDRPIEDRLTNRMIGGVHIADSEEYVFFDPNVERAWQAVVRAFPNERVRLESASNDFHKIVALVEGERDGYCFELVDLDTHRAEPLGDVYAGVRSPLEVRRITYAAADGLQIPGYLTLPRGKAPKNLPLIVLPHGGPAMRDTANFDWWSQALADQGYAVLRPNYRGSNLDWAFISRGFGEWGRKMQSDLSDGVRYLAKEGLIDPGRVCIVGASYGGYAALAGPSLDPGVYRCAVAVAGISDVKRMLNWVNQQQGGRESLAQRYWDRFMGVGGPNDPGVDAISPIRHLDAITVPVLLIHGKDDTVVPFEQSQAMYDALHGHGKDVQLVNLGHEDHWLSRSDTRLQMLEASVQFLRAHNPPD
jgi:dipeptidyl aminopeptidase/acylaminoacyl peptidase